MIEYEPEEVSRKLLCVLSLIVALATSYPSYSAITTGTTIGTTQLSLSVMD